MTIKLPVMNHLAQRWNLPPFIVELCDYYRLKRMPASEFFFNSILTCEGKLEIQEAGLTFQVIFQNGMPPAKFTEFWVSFRSMTFEFQGKMETKSIALVQPVKEGKVRKEAPQGPRDQSAQIPKSPKPAQVSQVSQVSQGNLTCIMPTQWKTWAERALPAEKGED